MKLHSHSSAMREDSLIGRGMGLIHEWNGVPALSLGVRTRVAISSKGLFQNMHYAVMERIGLKRTINGRIEMQLHLLELLSSLTGVAMKSLTTQDLWKNVRMELFIQWKVTLEMRADRDNMQSEIS